MAKRDVRTIRNKTHQLILLKVLERDELGRPKKVTVLYDENVENLQGGEEYFTAYTPEENVRALQPN